MDEEAKEYLGFIRSGTTRMNGIINDLLEYSRIVEKGKYEHFIEVDLDLVLQNALSNLKMELEESEAEIVVGDLPELKVKLPLITSLFQNLIANAIKYKGEEKPIVSISSEEKSDHWEIEIKDNGIGIDPKFHQDIFGVFKRLHSKDVYSGSGVGLATCKKVIDYHNGDIWVESELGEGASFFFSLPKSEAGSLDIQEGLRSNVA